MSGPLARRMDHPPLARAPSCLTMKKIKAD
jgi:hypothetical protein